MKNSSWLSFFIAVPLLFSVSAPTKADVALDQAFPWDKVLKEQHRLLSMGGAVADAVEKDQAAEGFGKQSYHYGGGVFHMIWNANNYYITGVQYHSIEQNAARDESVKEKKENMQIVPGGGVCALFVYDDQLKQLAKFPVQLTEAGGRTWCNGAEALARVKGEDALLFSVTYYLTDQPLAKTAAAIGEGWRHMTVLLRLSEQDGKVVVKQDDSCLGNPNNYGDIASARKALTTCAQRVGVRH